MKKIIEFLKYPSTLQGIVVFITAGLSALFPQYAAQIASVGGLIVGGHMVVKSDVDVK